MSINLLPTTPFAGGKDLWADVDLTNVPVDVRKMIDRARMADSVAHADLAAHNAALTAQFIRATAIALEFQLQLEKGKTP